MPMTRNVSENMRELYADNKKSGKERGAKGKPRSRAQMIATRGIGNTAVNDTFLRALNRKLLEGGDRLEWDAFWAELRPALGSNSYFQEYVPPQIGRAHV